jgi:two-component system sensor histidine kinase KdpD
VADTLEAAQKMGGLVISLKHENVAQALISFAKEYGITHVVIGRPGKKSLRLFNRALHDELIQGLPDTDLVII